MNRQLLDAGRSIQAEDFRTAQKIISEAITKYPWSADAHVYQAELYWHSGESVQADKELKTALFIFPTINGLNILAKSAEEIGNYEKAQEILEAIFARIKNRNYSHGFYRCLISLSGQRDHHASIDRCGHRNSPFPLP